MSAAPTTTNLQPDDMQALLDQFALCQATELARSGNARGAESLIKQLLQRPDVPVEVLDLQARIFAQHGRISEAENLWRRALERAPDNVASQAALARIRKLQRRPIWFAALWPAALAATAIIICIALIQFQSNRQNIAFSRWNEIIKKNADKSYQANDTTLTVMLTQIEATQSNQVVLANQQIAEVTARMTTLEQLLTTSSNTIQKLESTIAENINLNKKPVGEPIVSVSANPPATPTIAVVTNAPQQYQWPPLDITGIQQVLNEEKLRVIFDDGFFSHGTYFKLGAKARLTAVIKALAQSKQQLVIEVVGYSDGDQGFFGPLDPYSTGLKRAAATVDFIRSLAFFSPGQLRASSSGSAHLPFPSDSAKGGAKNRTVVLQISQNE